MIFLSGSLLRSSLLRRMSDLRSGFSLQVSDFCVSVSLLKCFLYSCFPADPLDIPVIQEMFFNIVPC